MEAAINKVAHENVVRLKALATNMEELHQIVELAVDITADCDR